MENDEVPDAKESTAEVGEEKYAASATSTTQNDDEAGMPVLQTVTEMELEDGDKSLPLLSLESHPPSLTLEETEVLKDDKHPKASIVSTTEKSEDLAEVTKVDGEIVQAQVHTTNNDNFESIHPPMDTDEKNVTTPVPVEQSGEKEEIVMEEEVVDPPGLEETSVNPAYYYWRYNISSDSCPKCLIQSSKDEFRGVGKKAASYLKGCKWAPDGSCLLSCSDDDVLRLFNFPSSFSSIQDWNIDDDYFADKEDWKSALKVKEGGLIYDYCWYPLMSSMDPVSSCFLTTSSLSPIHLWDAFTGTLRASYQPYNHLDQVISAYSLAFGSSGETIYSGFEKTLRIFNLTRPGRECIERKLKQPLSDLNQYGIIASIAANPSLQSFYALGSFDKTIGLYYEDGSVICLLQGHVGGVTHMKFSSDGLKLYSGGRKDSRLMCWDMRQMGEAYKIFDRVVDTHQRIYFDVSADDRYLVTGGTDGNVKIWDVQREGEEPCCNFRGNMDCVNGVSLNPYVPLLATSSGQRHFPEVVEDSDDEDIFMDTKASRDRSCDIKLWKLT